MGTTFARFLVAALVGTSASLAEAVVPQLTGLARQAGVDRAWLWFPSTAVSVVLCAGEEQVGYRLISVRHSLGEAELDGPEGRTTIRFAGASGLASVASESTAPLPTRPTRVSRPEVNRMASQNAARALRLDGSGAVGSGIGTTANELQARARLQVQLSRREFEAAAMQELRARNDEQSPDDQ